MRQLTLLIAGLFLLSVSYSAVAADKDAKKPKQKAAEQAPAEENGNSEIEWQAYDEGLEQAKEENKHVFIDFTAKWCGWCKKMDKETFSEPEVVELINEHFVPVRVDGDSQTELDVQGFKITERNLTRAEFGVRGFPSFWFLKPDGTKLGKIDGYRDKEFMMKALSYVKDYKYDTTRTEQSQTDTNQ